MTTFSELYDYCTAKPGAIEGYPFGEGTLVFKVAGRIFALTSPERLPPTVNLKCNPEQAVELRERYNAVQPGYHMNKQHWNTVTLDGSIPSAELRKMVDHSYALVVASLPKKVRLELREKGVGEE